MRTACYIIAIIISIVVLELTGAYLSNDTKQVMFTVVTVWVSFLLGAASEIFRK